MGQGIVEAQSGYECSETYTPLLTETITTIYSPDPQFPMADLAYSQPITADKLRITFNGTVYECNANTLEGGPGYFYGGIGESGPDFSEYPFAISSTPDPGVATLTINTLYTQTAGTYTIVIETADTSIEVSECFKKAVSFADDVMFVKYDHSETEGNTTTYYFDKTWQEVHDALVAGKAVTANAIEKTRGLFAVGLMDYITGAMEYNGSYQIGSVLTSTNYALPFETLSSPSDYLRVVTTNLE